MYPRLSPDGKWLAYLSNESGREEVYVGTFPMPGGKRQVSVNGGSFPMWSRDGKELYFVAADGMMIAVPIQLVSKFSPGVPKPHDISPDGRSFIVMTPKSQFDAGKAPLENQYHS